MKNCTKCNEKYRETLEFFPPAQRRKNGLGSWCRVCIKAHHAELYKRDPRRKESLLERNEQRRVKIQHNLMLYLSEHPCVDCGQTNPLTLDFDHTEDNKDFNIAVAMVRVYSWKTILKEISKCQVLCANCHRIKTARQFDTWKVKYLRSFSPTEEAPGREPGK